MNPAVKAILLNADQSARLVDDTRTNPMEEFTRLQQTQQDLLRDLGLDMELDESVQDATFHSELMILTEAAKSHREQRGAWAHETELSVRFSCFGDLVTVFSCPLGKGLSPIDDKFDLVAIQAILHRHGYVYVPFDQLDYLYDGPLADLVGRLTSWERFFDYVSADDLDSVFSY